jgi:DNA modification methylase
MTPHDERWRVELGECLAVLERMPAESIDAVVCDPPYGLSREPDVAEVLTHWLAGDDYVHRGGGFMGQTWDSFVPGPAVWREVLRVLKPGGHLLAFGGTRTYDLLTIALRLAGFEIRDRVLTLNGHTLDAEVDWLYGAGWPKSRNIGKAIDVAAGAEREVVGSRVRVDGKAPGIVSGGKHATFGDFGDLPTEVTAPATPEAERWEGWGTALKPAHEPIVVARKPFRGTVEANVLEHGTGALNIDACRITSADPNPSIERRKGSAAHLNRAAAGGWVDRSTPENYAADRPGEQLGRWPANVALIHAPGCERVGERVVRGDSRAGTDAVGAGRSWLNGAGPLPAGPVIGDELVDEWKCAPGCPVAQLDELSGEAGASAQVMGTEPSVQNGANGTVYSARQGSEGRASPFYGDRGGAARFFYSGKASPAERDAGLEHLPLARTGKHEDDAYEWKTDGRGNPRAERTVARNVHPTVKPIDLMRWLIDLVAPKGAVVLDPYAGSGSTGCAAMLAGVRFIGIDKDPTFVPIARARLAFWASFPIGTPVERVLAQETARRRGRDEEIERRRLLADAGQLDLLASMETPYG